jgi:hypothetical protein
MKDDGRMNDEGWNEENALSCHLERRMSASKASRHAESRDLLFCLARATQIAADDFRKPEAESRKPEPGSRLNLPPST